MKGWVTNFTGEYFESEDNISYSETIATPVPPMPSDEAKDEMNIQKEMRKILRKMAMDALKASGEIK
jgi:hypothetical protein